MRRTTLISIALAITCHGMASAGAHLDDVHPILKSMFDASGVTAGESRTLTARFDGLANEAADRFGNVRSPERRARRIHKFLHDRVFLRYRDDADGVDDVLARGDFNCVSSTLLEGLVTAALGLDATIVSGSRHVHLRLRLPRKTVEIETTYPDGFDAPGNSAASDRFLLADGVASPDAIALRGTRENVDGTSPVPLASGAAFVLYNAAERALARGEGRIAAEHLLTGETLYPGVATGGEGLQAQLGRAFRLDYDAARFDDAYVSAAIGVKLGPTVVSARDRLIAVSAQRVEGLLDRGEVRAAEDILVDLRGLLGDGADRFERHMLPLVVAAAVRVGDWERANSLSDRFAAVELDAVEGRRLQAWVRSRQP